MLLHCVYELFNGISKDRLLLHLFLIDILCVDYYIIIIVAVATVSDL